MGREMTKGERELLKGIEEAERLERDYKQATILLSKQMPALIDEMKLLRGAIDRKR